MTDTEYTLWYYLRGQRLGGWKFKRQVPVGGYIVDFICFEARLVIEIDGGQHDLDREYDQKRTQYLAERQLQVIRFWNNDVSKHIFVVLQQIHTALMNTPSPSLPTAARPVTRGILPLGLRLLRDQNWQSCRFAPPGER